MICSTLDLRGRHTPSVMSLRQASITSCLVFPSDPTLSTSFKIDLRLSHSVGVVCKITKQKRDLKAIWKSRNKLSCAISCVNVFMSLTRAPNIDWLSIGLELSPLRYVMYTNKRRGISVNPRYLLTKTPSFYVKKDTTVVLKVEVWAKKALFLSYFCSVSRALIKKSSTYKPLPRHIL